MNIFRSGGRLLVKNRTATYDYRPGASGGPAMGSEPYFDAFWAQPAAAGRHADSPQPVVVSKPPEQTRS